MNNKSFSFNNKILPKINKNLSRFFKKSENKSNILEKFFDREEYLVNNLDLTSENLNFNNSLIIKSQLEKNRIKKISENNLLKSNKITNEIDKIHLSEKKHEKILLKIMAIEKENSMKNELNNIKKLIEENQKEKQKIIEKISENIKKIEDENIEIEAIKSINLVKNDLLKNIKSNKNLYKSFNENLSTNSKKYSKNLLKFELKKDLEENEEKKSNFQKNILISKKILNENKLKLKEIKNNIEKLKIELKNKKNILLQYYHNILFEGIDTRKDGLSWVIIEIWNLNENVNMNFLPNFFDEKAIEYLFNISQKKVKINKIKKLMQIFKQKLFNDNEKIFKTIHNENNNNNNENNFSNDFFFDESENNSVNNSFFYMQNLKKKIYKNKSMFDLLKYKNNKNKEKITLNYLMKEELKKFFIYSPKKIKNYENIEKYYQLDKLEKIILADIENLKKKEINRITKEFLYNNYEKRFEISLETVLTALLGEYNKTFEKERQKNIKNEYLKKLKFISFYNTFKKE